MRPARTVDRAAGLMGGKTETALIGVDALSYRYPAARARALDEVSFEVERGAVLGLVGPNGSGKTTLCRLLLGLMRPQGGRVTVGGVEPAVYRRSHGVGYLPEQVKLPGDVQVGEFAVLMARLAGLRRCEVPGAVDRLMATLAIAEKVGVPISALSHGYRQRVGLLAALLGQPELLLLDEPANGLDPSSVGILRSVIRGLKRVGRTVIISSHNLLELERVCDDVLILRQGRVLGRSLRDELTRRSEIWVVQLCRQDDVIPALDLGPLAAKLGGVGLAADEVAFADEADARAFVRRIETAGGRVEMIERRPYDLEYLYHSLVQSDGEEANR